ncbi:MAG TPA: GyrI-like domain-containing protein, partial [Aquaticitalea sp.]|nr:GyrI-like domain-containing protein [Aquaticitalea sp.]
FFFIFFDISSLLLRYITPAIPRSSRLDLSKNILKNIDSYLNFRTLGSNLKFTYQYIYGQWIPNSEYELDDRPHFALMGEKYKDPESEEEFWIPIRKK